jgi:hypothetical protein
MNNVKIITANKSNKQALIDWEDFRQQILNSTTVDLNETEEEKAKRIKTLEANHEEWFKYYFPNFYTSEPAPFQVAATKRIFKNPEWYEVRAWSRELAKSTRAMMEDLKLMLTKIKKYKILVSNSWDNAARLVKPYKILLEANQRIINDYGVQEKIGSWEEGEITTRSGFSIRALGAGQSPRGTRKDAQRPDIIEFDDFDTDEECDNIDIIDKKWRWVNDAAIPTRSVSVPTLIRWCGNFIAEDCCIVRAKEFSDFVDEVNIRDETGKSSWPAKNTEEMIDRILSTLPFSSQQKEFYNNPYREGKTFKEMNYGKCPSLKDIPFVVVYADPATSNKDKPAVRTKKQNSCKAVVIVGYKDLKYFVYKCFVDTTTNSSFIDWLYSSRKHIGGKTQDYYYIENNSLQDPFYQQVFVPLIRDKAKENEGNVLGITPDQRDKPEKFFRIEGTLEPLNRNGFLILNIDEKEDPHMKRLDSQFKSVGPNSRTMDGPDAVEGAVKIIQEKVALLALKSLGKVYKKSSNSKRY